MSDTTLHILVGVDFSESSPMAVAHAVKLAERTQGRLHIAHIAVSKAHRGKGIGSTMVNSLEGNTVTLNMRRSNTKAQRLYYELGFRIVRTLPQHYADGEDGFFLSNAVA